MLGRGNQPNILKHVFVLWKFQHIVLGRVFVVQLLRACRFPYPSLSNHIILCHPLLLLPSIFPSIRVFPNESALHTRWPKYWSFHFSISPSKEYSELISFRIDWFDFHVVQGTLNNLQHHNSKASILWCSVFFMVQLSHPCMTTGKTIDLTRQTFASKVMLCFFKHTV